MSDQTTVSGRINELRDLLGLSQSEFADKVGITQGALSQLESGKSKLSLDSIVKISQAYNVDCNWLINGISVVFLRKKQQAVRDSMVEPSWQDLCLIPLIKEEAHAGYIDRCSDEAYISTLDVYRIPGYEEGVYRLFEVAGTSMLPSIYPREIVICEHAGELESIENGTLCVVIARDGIVAKRVYRHADEENTLLLKSDNPEFRTYSISQESVIEIWKVKGKITSVFAQEQLVDARKIEHLEADIQLLKEKVAQLNGDDNQPPDGSSESESDGR